jgi:hypothetical protein
VNTLLRIVLLIWIFGYLLVSCAPVLGANVFVGALGLAFGVVLFVPWLIGVIVLAVLVWLTNPGRSPY